MLRLDGDDARCIRNRGIATENAEAEAIARNAVRGKGRGGQLLAQRRAVSQKRAMEDLRNIAGAPANARKARGLEPPAPVAAPGQLPTESSRTTTQVAAPPAARKNSFSVPVDAKSLNRATDTRALDEYSDGGLSYDAGTGRRVRPSLVSYDDLKDLVEADERRLSTQDAYTGIEWLDNRGGEVRPYVSGENEEFPPEIRDYLEAPNFHSGFRPVRRKLETAVTAPRQVPPDVVKPQVFAFEGKKVKRPVPPKPPPPPPEKKEPAKKDLPPTVPRVYSAKKILFERTRDRTGKTVVFAGSDYLAEINHVGDILRRNPDVEVEIKAFVGPTWLAVQAGAELAGSTPAVYKLYGALMDARARKVRDMLVVQGVDPARIRLSRGESGIGEAYRRVDFGFSVP